MNGTLRKAFGSSAAVAVIAMGSAAPALAAKTHHRSHGTQKTSHSSRTGSTGGGSGETALTGTALSSASTAALTAVPGGTVERASTENDSSNTNAAYEVDVTKTDGSHVLVTEDSSFTVLSTTAGTGCGGAGNGPSATTSAG